MNIKEIAFVGYPFTDVERARAFYEGVLKLKPEMVHEFDDAKAGKQWWIEYEIGGVALALSNAWPPGGEGGPTVALEVDDLDAWTEEMKAKNVPVVLDMVDTPVCRFIVIQDPDGNGLTLHQRKEGCPGCEG